MVPLELISLYRPTCAPASPVQAAQPLSQHSSPLPTFSTTLFVSFSLIQGFSSAQLAMVLSAASKRSRTPASTCTVAKQRQRQQCKESIVRRDAQGVLESKGCCGTQRAGITTRSDQQESNPSSQQGYPLLTSGRSSASLALVAMGLPTASSAVSFFLNSAESASSPSPYSQSSASDSCSVNLLRSSSVVTYSSSSGSGNSSSTPQLSICFSRMRPSSLPLCTIRVCCFPNSVVLCKR